MAIHNDNVKDLKTAFLEGYTIFPPNAIKEYFTSYTYAELQVALKEKHAYVSLCNPKRLISKLGLHRRWYHRGLDGILNFISEEKGHSGQQNGYRFMCNKLKRAGLVVTEYMGIGALRLLMAHSEVHYFLNIHDNSIPKTPY